jgi:hypothetical protein
MDPGFWNFEQAEMLAAAGRSDAERYFREENRRRTMGSRPWIDQRLRDFTRPESGETSLRSRRLRSHTL